jgi:hypothetical protein
MLMDPITMTSEAIEGLLPLWKRRFQEDPRLQRFFRVKDVSPTIFQGKKRKAKKKVRHVKQRRGKANDREDEDWVRIVIQTL